MFGLLPKCTMPLCLDWIVANYLACQCPLANSSSFVCFLFLPKLANSWESWASKTMAN